MKKSVLFAGGEVMPFAATGGLGDVLGSLPAALASADPELDVRVVMPLYSAIKPEWREKMKTEAVFVLSLAWRQQYCGIRSLEKDGVKYYFIDNEYYFARDTLYGQYDDGERYAFFCKAVCEMMAALNYYPDILHAHDWQAALVPVYLKRKYGLCKGFSSIRTVFTIHNIEYQGKYDFAILGDVFELAESDRQFVEYGGCINLMKGAIVAADIVSTVSPRYAQEIMTDEYSHGLSGILIENAYKVRGILNGIDYTYYNPETDPTLPKNFSAKAYSGKAYCRATLRQEYELPDGEIPLIAVVSRLVAHKGLTLVKECLRGILDNSDAQFVVLGKGDAEFEEFFRQTEREYPDRVRALITYDRDLSKLIYASADIFLMPSKSEPCGLSQMIASRYGAIPVVRETGGLADSIHGYWEKDGEMLGNGFTFAGYSSSELYERTLAAIGLWKDVKKRVKFRRIIMKTDFSWRASAAEYLKMYSGIV